MAVRREQYAVQRAGNVLFGTLDLDWHDDGEHAAAIGLRTSNDKSMSIQLAIGARIFVCDNLCFSGDLIALKRKHTSRLDLPSEIAGGLDRYQEGFRRLQDDVHCWQNTPVSPERAKQLVYDIFRKKLVPVRLFHPVTQELYTSVRPDGLNLWKLHNAFTTHTKTLRPGPQFKAHVGLGKFFAFT